MDTRPRPPRRSGFTLVESLLGVSVTAICGTAVLLGLSSSISTADKSTEKLIADGLAQLYMDEILGKRFVEPGGSPLDSLGPGSPEVAALGRTEFDDMDDMTGVSNKPPKDAWNVKLGTDDGVGGQRHANFRLPDSYFQNWRVTCEVYFVSATDLTTKLTGTNRSNYRAIHVHVYVDDPQGTREVVDLRRVVGYVPVL